MDTILGILDLAFRFIFGLLDFCIYSIAGSLYNLIMKLAEQDIFFSSVDGVDIVSQISNNIYAFLGIIMLFRLAIAFVQYIMDPDKMTDSKTGGSKLVGRFIIVIILIILVPIAFKEAMKLQSYILKDNLIGKLAFGSSFDSDENESLTSENAGKSLAFLIYKSAALNIDSDVVSCTGNETVTCEFVNDHSEESEEILGKYLSGEINSIQTAQKYNLLSLRDDDYGFVFDYNFLISLGVGGFLAYVLLILCIDVALRSVTLAFYRIIAPIPVISYLIPGKDSLMNTWVKKCLSTYLFLFITLASFMFGFLLIIFISDKFLSTGMSNESSNLFVEIFLIIGVLLFMKKLPDVLKDLGLNTGGGMGLSLGKRLGAGAVIPGAIAGALAGGVSSYVARKNLGGSKWQNFKSAFGGAAIGTASGFKSGFNNKDGKGIISNSMKSSLGRAQHIKDGTNIGNRFMDQARMNMGLDTDNSQRKAKIKVAENKKLFETGKGIFDDYNRIKNENKINMSETDYAEWLKQNGSEKKFMAQRWKQNNPTNKNVQEYADTFLKQIEANDEFKAANNAYQYALQHGDVEQIKNATKRLKAAESESNTLKELIKTMNKTGLYEDFADEQAAFNNYDEATKYSRTKK